MEQYNFWCSKYKLFNGNEQLYEWAHPNLSTLDQVYHQPQIYQGSKESKVFLTKYEYWKKPVAKNFIPYFRFLNCTFHIPSHLQS